jgi:predicted dehydrogenase
MRSVSVLLALALAAAPTANAFKPLPAAPRRLTVSSASKKEVQSWDNTIKSLSEMPGAMVDQLKEFAGALDKKTGVTDVVVVGCGCPQKGMGWFHSVQMLNGECPSAKLNNIVEPWFLGGGADSEAGIAFAAFKDEHESDCAFHASLETLPAPSGPRMALIAGRTADNPKLLRDVVEVGGCTHVMLEKPGAPTVAELEGMSAYAKEKGVDVYMGYNKNIAKYITKAREVEAKTTGAKTKLVTLNAYKRDELEECFERNAEGMLKNMAIHELALAATFYGVRADNIVDVSVNKANSECLTLGGRTDFVKVEFTVTTTAGTSVTIFADRCGGAEAMAIVSDADGNEVFTSTLPDEELKAEVEQKMADFPEVMPYFWQQEADYRALKERCAAMAISGKAGAPEGVATIEIAVEALKIAEYLTPTLQKELL